MFVKVPDLIRHHLPSSTFNVELVRRNRDTMFRQKQMKVHRVAQDAAAWMSATVFRLRRVGDEDKALMECARMACVGFTPPALWACLMASHTSETDAVFVRATPSVMNTQLLYLPDVCCVKTILRQSTHWAESERRSFCLVSVGGRNLWTKRSLILE